MPDPRRIHRGATRALSAAMLLIGVAILVRTFAAGGGPVATGVLVGALFIAAGVGRIWIEGRR